MSQLSKRKILNDPVYGFINIPAGLAFSIIEHPYFQRMRNIKQLGLTFYVYPGAVHDRFQHALGAAYLMNLAIDEIRAKGHIITDQEAEAVVLAILLHDIGHGPFSHALEHSIVEKVSHEKISALFMKRMNDQFNGKLDLAIRIFKNKYSKKFLHQLVSSQLDVDRLDYLKRDSFFTGVSEGVIGTERIIKMLNVVNDKLVVESKGIYSIEKFLIARRLMYWQVYLHKTVISAEQLLVKILKRAKELADKRVSLFCSPSLHYFLYNKITEDDFNDPLSPALDHFPRLDDHDIFCAAKVWMKHPDRILAALSEMLINRKLFRLELQKKLFRKEKIVNFKMAASKKYKISKQESAYFVFSDFITNNAYSKASEKINILTNSAELLDITKASDILNLQVLSKTVKKHFLCYPKEGAVD